MNICSSSLLFETMICFLNNLVCLLKSWISLNRISFKFTNTNDCLIFRICYYTLVIIFMFIAELAMIIKFQNITPTKSKQWQQHGLTMPGATITISMSLSALPERIQEPWWCFKTRCNVHAMWFVPAEVTPDSIVWLDKDNCFTNEQCNNNNTSCHTTSNCTVGRSWC